jgi:hypothetical protein
MDEHTGQYLKLIVCERKADLSSFWRKPVKVMYEVRQLEISLKTETLAHTEIQRKVTTLLPGIPENDFADCFRQWHHRLTKCTASQGERFEGDSSR